MVAMWQMMEVWTRIMLTGGEMWSDSGVLEVGWSRCEDPLIGQRKGGIENGS